MGGWAVLDYALRYDPNPAANLRLGYASMLSAWALMNTGDTPSRFGFWTPGPGHDGAMSWGFQPRHVGTEWNPATHDLLRGAWPVCGEADHGLVAGIEAASTVLFEDPLFGLFAYGGELKRSGRTISVIPRDGVRQRFSAVLRMQKLHLALDRDGFARNQALELDAARNLIRFTLENRAVGPHTAMLRIEGLPAGGYALSVNGQSQTAPMFSTGAAMLVPIPVDSGSTTRVLIHPSPRSDR
jgi:hypothetical protein